MSDFHAFESNDEVLNIEGDALSIANGTTRIVVSGTLGIGKDKRGLKSARALKQAVSDIVAALERERTLPDEARDDPPAAMGRVDNPFL